jgi:ubiquinone/menaquinone biosynthesis C-methylase UbiE
VGVHPTAARGYGRAADEYERARPSYPAKAIDWLVERLGVEAGTTVVDLGAGTGKLTRLLVERGARLIALEPVASMRAKLEQTVPEAEVVPGRAEAIPLADGSADAVTAATAFHWFDPGPALREIHRVLRGEGGLGLIWNERDDRYPLQARLKELLRPYTEHVAHLEESRWRGKLESGGLFTPLETLTVDFAQAFDVEGMVTRVASSSVVAVLPEPEREGLLARVRQLALRQAQPIVFPYVTRVYACRRC